MGILRQNISSKVVVLVFTVEKQEVTKCFWWKWILLKKKLKFTKSICRLCFHIHQSLKNKY